MTRRPSTLLRAAAVFVLLGLACGCHRAPTASVLERYECHRCHDAPHVIAAAPQPRHCVHCHQAILEGDLDAEYRSELVALWKRRIVDLRAVPSLVGIDRRLRRDWVVEYLQQPHDLRPALTATMPRLAIDSADAEAIADALGIPRTEPHAEPVLGDAARGAVVLAASGCLGCHRFSGAAPEIVQPPLPLGALGPADVARALAPDLRFTRERMSAATLLAWLDDPAAMKPDTLMPRPPLDEGARLDVAAFILESPLAPLPSRVAPARLPVLARAVHYPEVERRVFRRICWHCHSDPVPTGGDGGPGNTGGFGFAGKGLDLGSRDAILRGLAERKGMPSVLEHMLARHEEEAGHDVPGVRGMPLGLPPIPIEDIQLVDTWIAQGSPP